MSLTIHEEKYPWSSVKPSYALEFSNDNNTFQILFEESESERISYSSLLTEYFFKKVYYFRYFRLRELDLASNSSEHA